jgi:AbrB family looped-hinge helix DNA binding protein
MKLLGNSKLTSKSQVTVPKPVREILELDIGDLLLYVKDHNQVILKRGRIEIEA